jgi:hypothetical protein
MRFEWIGRVLDRVLDTDIIFWTIIAILLGAALAATRWFFQYDGYLSGLFG